jgi:hypothetical protein
MPATAEQLGVDRPPTPMGGRNVTPSAWGTLLHQGEALWSWSPTNPPPIRAYASLHLCGSGAELPAPKSTCMWLTFCCYGRCACLRKNLSNTRLEDLGKPPHQPGRLLHATTEQNCGIVTLRQQPDRVLGMSNAPGMQLRLPILCRSCAAQHLGRLDGVCVGCNPDHSCFCAGSAKMRQNI